MYPYCTENCSYIFRSRKFFFRRKIAYISEMCKLLAFFVWIHEENTSFWTKYFLIIKLHTRCIICPNIPLSFYSFQDSYLQLDNHHTLIFFNGQIDYGYCSYKRKPGVLSHSQLSLCYLLNSYWWITSILRWSYINM